MPRASPLVACFTCRAVKLGSYHVVHPASLKRVAHRYEATTTSRRSVMRTSLPAAGGDACSHAVEALPPSSVATTRPLRPGTDGAARHLRHASPRAGLGS